MKNRLILFILTFAEQFERELSLNIPCLANAITVKYLTKGATNPIGKIVNQELFQDNRYSVKTLPQGYPYLCKAEHDGRDSRPSTITRWSNASFQDRFFDAFCHEGEPYTIILSVDGVWLRNQHFTMLDRSGAGGTRNPVLQSKVPTSVGDQSGVILSVKGVPVVNFSQLLASEALDRFRWLSFVKTHFTLVIDGVFTPIMDRTTLNRKWPRSEHFG